MELKNNKTLTRKEKEYLYHKKDIMCFAVEVFGKYGYETATTAEISDSAGYAKGSLYVYFKNKRELFLEVVNEILNDIVEIIDEFCNAKPFIVPPVNSCSPCVTEIVPC